MGKIKLEPSLLLAQAGEMERLGAEYEDLFRQVTAVMERANANWSPNLAHNFSGKIASAQRGFSGVVDMLGYGASAARMSAQRFVSIDSQIARYIHKGDGSGGGAGRGFGQNSSGGGGGRSFEKDSGGGAGRSFEKARSAASLGAAAAANCVKTKASWWDKLKKAAGKGAKFIKDTYDNAVDITAEGLTALIDDYSNQGLSWKVLKTGTAIVGAVGAVAGAAAAWGLTAGSGGAASPLAALTTLHAANTVSNSMSDIWNIWSKTGDKSKVGNVDNLKDLSQAVLGEEAGGIVYGVSSLAAGVAGATALAGKVANAKTFAGATKGLKGVKKATAVVTTVVANGELLHKVASTTEKMARCIVDPLYSAFNDGEKAPTFMDEAFHQAENHNVEWATKAKDQYEGYTGDPAYSTIADIWEDAKEISSAADPKYPDKFKPYDPKESKTAPPEGRVIRANA